MPDRESFFRDEDHKKSTLVQAGVAVIAIIVSVFMSTLVGSWMISGTVNGDHQQLSQYVVPNIIAMSKQYGDLEHRVTINEERVSTGSATLNALSDEIKDLHTSVSQLTLAVQKLTDLLPDKRPK